jgi:hypothetical protein
LSEWPRPDAGAGAAMDFVVIRVYLLWIACWFGVPASWAGHVGVDDAARAVE